MTLDAKLVENPEVEGKVHDVEDTARGEDHDVVAAREEVESYYARMRAKMTTTQRESRVA